MHQFDDDTAAALLAELDALRDRVTGVRGCVIGGMDGLLFLQQNGVGSEPHDVAALAAASFGVGRQSGLALRDGQFLDCTIHSQRGYFSVYAISESVLLSVSGSDGLNVARLHLEVRGLAPRLAALLARVPEVEPVMALEARLAARER